MISKEVNKTDVIQRFTAFMTKLANSTRAMTSDQAIGYAIAVLLLGVLLPIGLQQWESYTPTDPTLLLIWPICAVLILLGIVVKFYRDAKH